ncbi:Glycine cleavage system T protein (Aminomethyltransferase) [uncultured Pleomorphomonas sp.]|uniref:Glycine cleavage system T protein (Aminomethyltransferase) n=1 Tax=uncultured Pleomorphomonas sp. TaxID=442121 RepID=A0A212LG05_9HYPH|nr:aminomethyltransferase family protein [uncultured Pleomorphomonas sp.]SCM76397.1 Glycine cleavage system T protein (Aminomethyltransferase) [uncultured Pleomorphomonas sp.]
MRIDPTNARTTIAAYVGVPPYGRGITRFRKAQGLKHTAFYPIIGAASHEFKLHNSYLKPDRITDPLEEYWIMRRVAGLWDVTGEEVIELRGPDAFQLVNELIPRDLARTVDGQCLYSVLTYDYGGIVEDGIVVRWSPDRIWWVGGPGSAEQWIWQNARGRNVSVTSYNDEIHVASLQGPKSREILQTVTKADLSKLAFYHAVETEVAGVPVQITRTGYTAELGYDIYVTIDKALRLFADLWEVSRKAGATLAGSRALGLRRVEAAILNFGQDFDWQHTPFEAGLGWMVNRRKGFFHGREALLAPGADTPARHIGGLRLGGTDIAREGDPVEIDGRQVGTVTSANYSPALDASIAIAFLDRDVAAPGRRLTVRFEDRDVPAETVPIPFFDPERKLSKV